MGIISYIFKPLRKNIAEDLFIEESYPSQEAGDLTRLIQHEETQENSISIFGLLEVMELRNQLTERRNQFSRQEEALNHLFEKLFATCPPNHTFLEKNVVSL